MKKQEFDAWFDNFHKQNKGMRVPPTWFDTFEKRHDKLREKLGGVSKSSVIEVDSISNPLEYNDIKDQLNKLIALVPEYFNQASQTINPMDLTVPFKKNEKSEVRWGKSIQQYIKRLKNKDINEQEVNKVLSQLGEKWARCKIAKQPVAIEVTTDPRAFALLGHYPTDQNKSGSWSCFKQGAGHQMHKYMLALQENSYIILAGEKTGLVDSLNDVKMRGWGIANGDLDIFNVCNVYFYKGTQEAIYLKSLDSFFSEFLGTKKPIKISNKISVVGVFQNKHVNLSYTGPNVNFLHQEYIIKPTDGLDNMVHCARCRQADYSPVLLDGARYCEECVRLYSYVCDLSGERTFQRLYAVRDRTHNVIKVLQRYIADGTFVACALTGSFCHRDDMVLWLDGSKVSKFEVEERKYPKCESCDKYGPSVTKHPHKEQKLCQLCITTVSLKDMVDAQKIATGKVLYDPMELWSYNSSTSNTAKVNKKYGYFYKSTGNW